jgi:hypothetical protein
MFNANTVYIEDRLRADGSPYPLKLALVTDVRRDDREILPGAVARYTFAEGAAEVRRRAVHAVSLPEESEGGVVTLHDLETVQEARAPVRTRYRPLTRANFEDFREVMVGWKELDKELATDFELAYYFRMMLEDAILD